MAKTTKEMIEVMQAFDRGETIEVICRNVANDGWDVATTPNWDWGHFDYRVAPKPKKQIKMHCYLAAIELVWVLAGTTTPSKWTRVPSEDKTIEVDE